VARRELYQPDRGDCSHSVALGAELRPEGLFFHLILNAYWEPLEFELPSFGEGHRWRRRIDTALDSPQDIVPWEEAPTVPGDSYRAGARSGAMLFSRASSGASLSTPRDEVLAEISHAPTDGRQSGREGSIGGLER
jgi:hypothetical protein